MLPVNFPGGFSKFADPASLHKPRKVETLSDSQRAEVDVEKIQPLKTDERSAEKFSAARQNQADQSNQGAESPEAESAENGTIDSGFSHASTADKGEQILPAVEAAGDDALRQAVDEIRAGINKTGNIAMREYTDNQNILEPDLARGPGRILDVTS